ncbi:MAG: mannosyltransferase family protein, partial [Thermomicrobiales bacterium]
MAKSGFAPFRAISAFYNALTTRRFLFPIAVFLVHYAIVQVTATLAYMYGTARGSSEPYPKNNPYQLMTGFWENIVGPLRLWDGLWYKQVAERGYDYGAANAAFWPLLPWVMKYGERLTGLQAEVVGYLFTNACFAGSLIVVFHLLKLDFSDDLARKAIWGLALFPTSLFFSAVYTEAPFLL